jgi:hypothetical protein
MYFLSQGWELYLNGATSKGAIKDMAKMSEKELSLGFNEYIRQGEPNQYEKAGTP